MKSSALLCATLLCLGAAAEAREKTPGGRARGAGASAATGCDPADLEACAAWAERQLAADPGDQGFERERKEAQASLRTACSGGVLRACSSLADSLERFSPAASVALSSSVDADPAGLAVADPTAAAPDPAPASDAAPAPAPEAAG